MKINRNIFTVLGLLALSMSATADPITPTITYDPGVTVDVSEISEFQTNGNMMDGMLITASFSDGVSEVATFGTDGTNSGIAAGDDWSLSIAGDTFFQSWIVTIENTTNAILTGLNLNGIPGKTVFDTILGAEITPGSAAGKPISSVDGPAGLTLAALYSNQVTLNGTLYGGDLYGNLGLTLAGTNGGLLTNETLSFVTDTDNLVSVNPVPVPGAVLLFGSALLGLFGFKRSVKS